MTKKQLVVRGDDGGSCDSANAAILEAFQNGILRNTSLMATGSALDEAAELLRDLNGLCLGLHVTLTSEWDAVKWGPVLSPGRVPSLVDENGHFFPSTRALAANHPHPDEMMAEASAQLTRLRSKGLSISYLDDHMGVGHVGTFKTRLEGFAKEEGLNFVSGSPPRLPRLETSLEDPATSTTATFIARVRAAPPGTYLVITHPGHDAEDMRAYHHAGLAAGEVARQRDADRRMLTDRGVIAFCGLEDVALLTFAEFFGTG